MPLDAHTLLAVAAVAAGAAVIGGIGGFGTGIILTAALAPLIGFKAVVPVLAVAGVIINAGRFWFYRAAVDLRAVARVCAGALPLLVAGTWIYSELDARTIGVILGLVVLASVPLRRFFKKNSVQLGPRGVLAGGAVFGLASGVASGTGAILISLLLGAGLSGTAVLATDALTTIVLDLVKTLLFERFAVLDLGSAALGAAIGLASIPGSALAAWLVARMGAKLHVLAMEALIVAGGVFMLWHALK